jgi:hypothetical protein
MTSNVVVRSGFAAIAMAFATFHGLMAFVHNKFMAAGLVVVACCIVCAVVADHKRRTQLMYALSRVSVYALCMSGVLMQLEWFHLLFLESLLFVLVLLVFSIVSLWKYEDELSFERAWRRVEITEAFTIAATFIAADLRASVAALMVCSVPLYLVHKRAQAVEADEQRAPSASA